MTEAPTPAAHSAVARENAYRAVMTKESNSNGTSGIVSSPSAVVNDRFRVERPGKWQESPSAPWLESPDRPQKVRLIARGTSAPRRARSDPRRAAPTAPSADRTRSPVLARFGDRNKPARLRLSLTAVGCEAMPSAAVKWVPAGA